MYLAFNQVLFFLFFGIISVRAGNPPLADTALIRVYNESTRRCVDEGNDSARYYNNLSLSVSRRHSLKNFDGQYLEAYLLIREKKLDDAFLRLNNLASQTAKSKNQKELAKSNYLFGLCYEEKGDVDNSLKYTQMALSVCEKSKDSAQLIRILSQLGRIYKKNNKLTEGLEYYLRSARLAEQIKDSSHMYSSYINLGTLYQKTSDNKKALSFYYKALEINKRDNDTNGYAICYLKLSTAWAAEHNTDSSYYYINKCVELHRLKKNEAGLVSSLTKLAGALYEKGESQEALKVFDEAILLSEKLNDNLFLVTGLNGKAKIFLKLKKYPEAIVTAKKAINLYKDKTDYVLISQMQKLIADINFYMGNYREAYEYQVLHKISLDCLAVKNDIKKQTELKLSYEFDQIQEKQRKEAFAKEIENNLRIESEKKQRYFLIVLLVLALTIVLIAVKSYINKRKSNFLLEKKNMQLDNQKQLLEVKNKEINDSINYAKHIQTACLPDKEQLDSCFDDYYLLFKPRDIVSGDFFWTAKTEKYILLGVADCTGHGVPGAIMSMIGSILLNEIFIVKHLYSPEKVLQELNRVVKLTLKQEGISSSRDGMDIAYCTWDKEKQQLLYAGANRPLYIITRKGELHEYKPTKLPIGGNTDLNQEYGVQIIPLSHGDRIVLTTDGFADQFGGEKAKKINTKNFKNKLLEIASLQSNLQKSALNEYFEKWKGVQEQTDDVLVFSFVV